MADVKVAPPPLYYAQADGTNFYDSAKFGKDLESKTAFRNLIAEFMRPSASEPARLEDPSRPWFPMWRVNVANPSQKDPRGIAVVAPSGLNGSAKAEFPAGQSDWNRVSEFFERWFFEPAVTVDGSGKAVLGVGAGTVHRAHLVVMSSHGWLGGFAGGEIWEQRKWYLVGRVAHEGRGFRGPVWVILTQCSTMNSATWPSWAKVLANSSPHVRGILGYEESAPGARTAAAIGQGFVQKLKEGQTFLQAWRNSNPSSNWAAIVHKDAVGDKLKDLHAIVAGKKPLADVSTTETTFNYYGYLRNYKGGAAQEIYLKEPPFGFSFALLYHGARYEIGPATLDGGQSNLADADVAPAWQWEMQVASTDGKVLSSVAVEWIHIRPTKRRLQMDKVWQLPATSESATVTNTGAKKETFTARLDSPSTDVTLTWKAQPKSVMSAVTADQSYHGDDKLVPHHSYLYPRVTITPSGGGPVSFDFPTNGLSWYG